MFTDASILEDIILWSNFAHGSADCAPFRRGTKWGVVFEWLLD
jgi:hypothetical protein